jgi:hypothetical protein
MEFGLLDPEEVGPMDVYVLDMIAIGHYYSESGAAQAKDLKSDIQNKWKLEEMEYQARKLSGNAA